MEVKKAEMRNNDLLKKPLRERCKICGKVYDFTVENFRYCLSCGHFYCKQCCYPCQSCFLRDVDILCAEKFQERYKPVSRIHRCEQCTRLFSHIRRENSEERR